MAEGKGKGKDGEGEGEGEQGNASSIDRAKEEARRRIVAEAHRLIAAEVEEAAAAEAEEAENEKRMVAEAQAVLKAENERLDEEARQLREKVEKQKEELERCGDRDSCSDDDLEVLAEFSEMIATQQIVEDKLLKMFEDKRAALKEAQIDLEMNSQLAASTILSEEQEFSKTMIPILNLLQHVYPETS